ncbi:hypothetical protein B9Z19DRAFT_71841 [Tuber borchii]|uniref:Uncharacterized protein n=1 Tax=Tuber borchii TaxID=42251 RepID=A0A2T6ZSM0_TUBBO|nr:hypothetical protein B9Z19DRAFT_71841 [Tuber borchii]
MSVCMGKRNRAVASKQALEFSLHIIMTLRMFYTYRLGNAWPITHPPETFSLTSPSQNNNITAKQMFPKLTNYAAAPGIRLRLRGIQGKYLTTQSQPSSPDAIHLSSHPLPHHRPVLPVLHPATAKRHHKAKAGQISIFAHLAKVKQVEEIWYQRNRQAAMDANQQKDKLYQDVNQQKDKFYREITTHVAENTRLQIEVLKEVDKRLRVEGNFNVRGGLGMFQ